MKKVRHFFVQNDATLNLLQKAGISQCSIAGDTRFDRVLSIAMEVKSFPLIDKFCADSNVLVAGSTWGADEKIIANCFRKVSENVNGLNAEKLKLKLVITSHEVNLKRIKAVEENFQSSKSIRYSQADSETISSYDVLIIDNIGMLSSLYRSATICYIGGGFGKGIHNILEAAVFGKPVLFGPEFRKFEEAKELVKRGGATCFTNDEQLYARISELLSNQKKYREQCQISQAFVHDNSGAVDRIITNI